MKKSNQKACKKEKKNRIEMNIFVFHKKGNDAYKKY